MDSERSGEGGGGGRDFRGEERTLLKVFQLNKDVLFNKALLVNTNRFNLEYPRPVTTWN